MTSKRYANGFKAEAVKQITARGYPVAKVAQRLGVSSHSLYAWRRESGVSLQARNVQQESDLPKESALAPVHG